jgi:Flp pilus assembly protein TadD
MGANDVDETELFNQALAAAQAGQTAQARRVLAELVNINPRHEQAWLRLAGVVDNAA